MKDLTEGQERVVRGLWEAGAIEVRQPGEPGFEFKIHQRYPKTPRSPFKAHIRTPDVKTYGEGTLTPELVHAIGHELYDLTEDKEVSFTYVAGIPNAGRPLASEFVIVGQEHGREIPQVTLHKEGVGDSRHITDQVDGDYAIGDRLLVIDDLISQGETKLEAIEAGRGAGLEITDLAVFINWLLGGPEQLRRLGVETHAVITSRQLFNAARSWGLITEDLYDEFEHFLRIASRHAN